MSEGSGKTTAQHQSLIADADRAGLEAFPDQAPLARYLQTELESRVAGRNERMTLVAHTLGYDLQCTASTTSVRGYARELGHGGIRVLIDWTQEVPSDLTITLCEGNLNPVPFDDMIAPTTNWIKIRPGDINSYSYHVTRAYMIRLEPEDSEEPFSLTALASGTA